MDNTYNFDEKIDLIKETILKHVAARYIYLFGSHAYGEPNDDSDIDIYAVIPDTVKNDVFLRVDIQEDLFYKDILDVDLHTSTEINFEKYRSIKRFEETIYEKGKLIYETS